MPADRLDRLTRGAPLWAPPPGVDPPTGGIPVPASATQSAGVLREILGEAARLLERAEVIRPGWTAEQLLAHRLGCQPIELRLEPDDVIASPPRFLADEAISFRADVAARASGVPLQYLMGSASFYGREFAVGPGVFIPRPETEVLIDAALDSIASPLDSAAAGRPALGPSARCGSSHAGHPRASHSIPENVLQRSLVDVGTGSGAIAITLKLERPNLKVFGVDSSELALSFARRNANRHQADVTFLRSDLLDSFGFTSADLIVANLPYIDPATVPQWPRELHWEPWLALNGGEKGLSLIRQLIPRASSILNPGGQLLLEVGQEQVAGIRSFAAQHGFQFERLVHDLAGLPRVVVLSYRHCESRLMAGRSNLVFNRTWKS